MLRTVKCEYGDWNSVYMSCVEYNKMKETVSILLQINVSCFLIPTEVGGRHTQTTHQRNSDPSHSKMSTGTPLGTSIHPQALFILTPDQISGLFFIFMISDQQISYQL